MQKRCGYDGIFNEHLKNGGSILYEQLELLYTDMYNHGYIPEGLKKGITRETGNLNLILITIEQIP